MGFVAAVSTCLSKYATFSGRASRSEYWWFWLFGLILTASAYLFDVFFGWIVYPDNTFGPNLLLVVLATALPSLATWVRRLHDVGRSAWWLLLIAAGPGAFVLIYWICKKGTSGENRFGPDPLRTSPTPPAASAPAPQRAPKGFADNVKHHWRGGFSPGRSFWINGVLFQVVMTSIIVTIAVSAGATMAAGFPRLWLPTLGVLAIAATGIPIWQNVGAWRSSGRQSAHRGAKALLALTSVIAFNLVLSAAKTQTNLAVISLKERSAIPSGFKLIRESGAQAVAAEFRGFIGYGAADELEGILRSNPSVRLLGLDSDGGRVNEARRMRELIGQRGLSTYSSRGCRGACVLAFMAGKDRLVGRSFILGIDRPLDLPPQLRVPEFEVPEQVEVAETTAVLREVGAAETFIARVADTSRPAGAPPSLQEFAEAGIATHIVHNTFLDTTVAVADLAALGGDEAIVRRVYRDDASYWDAGWFFTLAPMLAAVKRSDPELYRRMIEIAAAAAEEMRTHRFLPGVVYYPDTELHRPLLRAAEDMLKARLPASSADALRSYFRVLAEQADDSMLKAGECRRVISGAEVDSILLYRSLQSQLRALTAVIASARDAAPPPAGDAAADERLESLLRELSPQLKTAGVSALRDLWSAETDAAAVCEAGRLLYRKILELPVPESTVLLRRIASHHWKEAASMLSEQDGPMQLPLGAPASFVAGPKPPPPPAFLPAPPSAPVSPK